MHHDLLLPMFAMVVLTILVGGITFVTRVRAVTSGKLDIRYFKTFNFGDPPEEIIKTQRHFANLFEIPVLFYAACLAGMITGAKGTWPVVFAWLFVAARMVHAWIHLGNNRTMWRMRAFIVGVFAVSALWVCVMIQA
jgi:hypothetical protein